MLSGGCLSSPCSPTSLIHRPSSCTTSSSRCDGTWLQQNPTAKAVLRLSCLVTDLGFSCKIDAWNPSFDGSKFNRSCDVSVLKGWILGSDGQLNTRITLSCCRLAKLMHQKCVALLCARASDLFAAFFRHTIPADP